MLVGHVLYPCSLSLALPLSLSTCSGVLVDRQTAESHPYHSVITCQWLQRWLDVIIDRPYVAWLNPAAPVFSVLAYLGLPHVYPERYVVPTSLPPLTFDMVCVCVCVCVCGCVCVYQKSVLKCLCIRSVSSDQVVQSMWDVSSDNLICMFGK